MAYKYYAVRVGRKPGIYKTWAECESMVKGYNKPVYKGFSDLESARRFVYGEGGAKPTDTIGIRCEATQDREQRTDADIPYAFVDGSYNQATGVYGYGGFLVFNGEKHVIQGSGSEPDMASMRNVAGEILGSMAAVELALKLGIKELAIYYDYMGIEMWAKGSWKRNKRGTIEYYNYMQQIKDRICVRFIKVKGHTGISGNEEADLLAKKSAGIL